MDAQTLRAAQAPLKVRYRDDPLAAMTPLHARATFEDEGVTCTVQGWAGPVREAHRGPAMPGGEPR